MNYTCLTQLKQEPGKPKELWLKLHGRNAEDKGVNGVVHIIVTLLRDKEESQS